MKDPVRFTGTIKGPPRRTVTINVERGSEAHAFALSRGWLTQEAPRDTPGNDPLKPRRA